jgi:hypothetical protein
LPRRNREAFNAPQPINRILQQSCRIKIGKFECRAVFSSSLSGKLPAANAAAPLMPSGNPSQRGKSHYGLIAGALFLARGGYAERLARPPTVFGYMPAMADAACRPENAAAAVALSS